MVVSCTVAQLPDFSDLLFCVALRSDKQFSDSGFNLPCSKLCQHRLVVDRFHDEKHGPLVASQTPGGFHAAELQNCKVADNVASSFSAIHFYAPDTPCITIYLYTVH